MTMPWHIARNLLRSASSAEAVTGAVELALKFEGRLEDGGSQTPQHRRTIDALARLIQIKIEDWITMKPDMTSAVLSEPAA